MNTSEKKTTSETAGNVTLAFPHAHRHLGAVKTAA